MLMEVEDLVDAALVGFDRREPVTIPPLPDDAPWTAMQDARLSMAPTLSRRAVAARYQSSRQSKGIEMIVSLEAAPTKYLEAGRIRFA